MEMFLQFWQSWPVFVTALVTLGVTVYAFLPSEKSATAAMVYQVVTVMSFILALPAVLINPQLDLALFQITDPSVQVAILWLNLLGGLVALLSFLLSILGIGQTDPSTAGQRFVKTPLGAQHQAVTPKSFHHHSAGQAEPQQPPVHFSQAREHSAGYGTSHATHGTNHSGYRTSHAGEYPTDLVNSDSDLPASASSSSYPVPTLDESASQSSTEFTDVDFTAEAPPTPARPATKIEKDEEKDQTIVFNPPSQAEPPSIFAWLVALDGQHRGEPHALIKHRNVIGRAKASDIVVKDKAVSGQHAAILRDDEQQLFMLHDLRSANGTHLHGQAITSPQPLKDKDRLRVGETDFHFMEVRLHELLPDYESSTPADADKTVILTR